MRHVSQFHDQQCVSTYLYGYQQLMVVYAYIIKLKRKYARHFVFIPICLDLFGIAAAHTCSKHFDT